MSIIVELPDTELNRKLSEPLATVLGGRYVVCDDTLPLPLVDTVMRDTILQMQSEQKVNSLKMNKFDYVWLMKYINEEPKGIPLPGLFYSVRTFRDYLVELLEINGIGSASLMAQYGKCQQGRFPEWTFTDIDDEYERLRRVNIVRRCVAISCKEYRKNVGKL